MCCPPPNRKRPSAGRPRAGHARPLQGCNSPGRDDLFADVCHSGKVRGSPPHIQTAKGAAAVSRGRDAAIFCASHKKIPHRPEQRTMGAKRNKQTAKKAQSKTPKRRRSLLLAGAAPERQNSRQARGWLWLVAANHAYTLPYCSSDVKHFPKIIPRATPHNSRLTA